MHKFVKKYKNDLIFILKFISSFLIFLMIIAGMDTRGGRLHNKVVEELGRRRRRNE